MHKKRQRQVLPAVLLGVARENCNAGTDKRISAVYLQLPLSIAQTAQQAQDCSAYLVMTKCCSLETFEGNGALVSS